MCKLCEDIKIAKIKIDNTKCSGVSLGRTSKSKVWEDEYPIEMTLWYDKEGNMKSRTTLIELSMCTDDEGNGVRLIYPVKYCPNCGEKLVV